MTILAQAERLQKAESSLFAFLRSVKPQSKVDMEIQCICQTCGKEFTARRTGTRYCSHRCACRAYYLRVKSQPVGKGIRGERASQPEPIASQEGAPRSFSQKENRTGKRKETSPVSLRDELLTIGEAATLMKVCRQTIYNMAGEGAFRILYPRPRMPRIRRSELDAAVDDANVYRAKPRTNSGHPAAYYSIKEVKQKYRVGESTVYAQVKKHRIPKTLQRGKCYLEKNAVEQAFGEQKTDPAVTCWISVTQACQMYRFSPTALYAFVRTHQIPKKREGRSVSYSREHLDRARKEGGGSSRKAPR